MLKEDCPHTASRCNLGCSEMLLEILLARVVCVFLCSSLLPISLVKFLPFSRDSGFDPDGFLCYGLILKIGQPQRLDVVCEVERFGACDREKQGATSWRKKSTLQALQQF